LLIRYLWLALCAAPSVAFAQSATATGITRDANPAISANALFTGLYAANAEEEDRDEHEHSHGPGSATGLRVQEVEVQLTSFVDPLWKADLILALPGGDGVELEEGFVTSQALPGGLQLKVGKFLAEVGRHNRLHAHAFPFLDAPLVVEHLLGDEGLNEAGLSLSWLTPLPSYVELTGQVLDGANERFAGSDGEELLYLGHSKAFWELGDATTMELGATAAAGGNAAGGTTSLLGADLTVKWRPLGVGRRALVWQTEYLRVDDSAAGGQAEGGLYSLAQLQLSRRWWLQSRVDLMGLPKAEDERDWRLSAGLALVPSEFSSVRLQYDRLHAEGDDADRLSLQLNITIGSHPAHRY
jgi:hypothetical protein